MDLYNQMISRQVEIFNKEQQNILKTTHVTVFGCGGLGGTVIEQLVRAGFENIAVIDQDVFDKTNFNRQIRSNLDTVGKSKAQTVVKESLKINPNINMTCYDETITQDNIESILNSTDVLLDAVDNVYTRVVMSRACKKLKIPFVHAAVERTQGQLTIFKPEGPSYEEIFKLKSCCNELDDEIISYLKKISSKKPQVLGVTASIFAALEVNETIKYLLNVDDVVFAPRVMLWDIFDLSSLRIIEF